MPKTFWFGKKPSKSECQNDTKCKMTLYTSGSRIWVAGPRFCPQAWPGAIVLNHHESRVLISLRNSSGSRHKNKIQHHATQSNILQYLQFKPNFQYVAISIRCMQPKPWEPRTPRRRWKLQSSMLTWIRTSSQKPQNRRGDQHYEGE